MVMKLSTKKCLLHVSTIALSGLLFTNTSGVMNAAESNDISNQQSAEQSALVTNTDTTKQNTDYANSAHVADANTDESASSPLKQTANSNAGTHSNTEGSVSTNADQSTNSQQATQKKEMQQPAATHENQAGKDDSAKSQSEASSYSDLPEAGHVDHPEQGAVIAIIIGIVVSTIALIKTRRQSIKK
ncbi:hypothetical protein [Staphylococcus debuckii]|uniref:hypothetical protein n=1 Tax=Staphylococcus debuckii TaxID=2044912 RepID=UPI000F435E0F|nr:hypothetical protein [Staphylococcus debuckii]AYU56094.1 hypothetical protein CNQ82_11880 [Staphylococcus debuckii]